MARLGRHGVMDGFLCRNHRRLVVERFEAPRVRHDSECRPALYWRRRRYRVLPELRLLVFVRGVVRMLRTGAFCLAQGLHEQAHRSPGGRAGTR
jgi:hypothetical protein